MNFKDMLEKISQLSEATEKTATGIKHKADPGGYGRKFDTDEEGDEKKKDAEPAAKRGRGRPKKGSDETGDVKKYSNAKNLQDIMVGNKPKKSKELDKLPAKKHSLKDWFEHMEKQMIAEAEQVTIQPAQSSTQVIKQGTKTLGTVSNPTLAATIKSAIGKGEMSLAGDKLGEEEEYSAKKARAGKDIGKPGKQFAKIAKSAGEKYGSKERGEKVAGAVLAKLRKGVNEVEQPTIDNQTAMGAGLGAGRSKTTLEAKAAKPDYIDLDKDGNKKESMKKAAADKKKKEVKEGMSHKLHAARLEGKAHGLKGHAYHGKAFDDMEEARAYHEGYKEGLDECYGMNVRNKPIVGLETAMPAATVPGMAQQAMPTMEDDMEEGNLFTGNLAKARAAGKKMADLDGDGDMEKVTEFAFEDLDRELEKLLTEGEEKIEEGMSVSISKGQQGMPDTVSVSAQDAEADQLLGLIKTLGGGLFGGEEQHSDYGTPAGSAQHGGISVVDDHDGMLALMKKMTVGDEHGSEDYADEEGNDHDEEETCNECGTMYTAEGSCGCDEGKEMVDEVESEDQMEYEVAEDNAPDSGAEDSVADEDAEAAEDAALAKSDMQNKTDTVNEDGDEASEEGEEDMSASGDETGEEVEESLTFESLYKKLAFMAEESTEKEDEKAEKAGKKVTKDIEYDDKKDKEKKLDEWANEAGPDKKGTDASFEQDIEFMTKVISGGLNKPKSTGQTTVPVVASQLNRQVSHHTTDINESSDSVSDWKKLAGIK